MNPPNRSRSSAQTLLTAALCLSVLLCAAMLFFAWNSQRNLEKLASQYHETTPTELTEPTAPPATAPTVPVTEVEETVAPTEPILEKFQELYAQNNELFGWVTIPNTLIDYPVMYSPQEPNKYLETDFEGKYSFSGVPFVQGDCKPDSTNLILHSHNMMNGTMFATLLYYRLDSFWAYSPTIYFSTLYEEQEYEVFAVFKDRVYDKSEDHFEFYRFIDPATEEEFNEGIAYFKEHSLYDTGITPAYGDKLLMMVTCAYHEQDGRFVVVARLKESPQEE